MNAIQKAKSTDYRAHQKVLRSVYMDTTVGRIRFDGRGDAIGVGFSMYQVRDGKYVQVK